MMKIAVFTIKGGVGKTALVLLLGLAFATEFKKKVLLVDTDLQADLSYRILGDSLSIYSIFSEEYYGIGRFSSLPNLRARPINIMDNLDLIPMEHDAFINVDQQTIMRKLSALPEGYDIILIDTPPSFDRVSAEELLRNVDAYFSIVAPAKPSIRILNAELRLILPMLLDKIKNTPYFIGIIKNNIYSTNSREMSSAISMLNDICDTLKAVPHHTPCVFTNEIARRQAILNYDSFAFLIKTKNTMSISRSLSNTKALSVAQEFLYRLQKYMVSKEEEAENLKY